MDIKKSVDTLKRYNDWRTGNDHRTMDEAGVVPHEITIAIDTLCNAFDSATTLKATRNGVVRTQVGECHPNTMYKLVRIDD